MKTGITRNLLLTILAVSFHLGGAFAHAEIESEDEKIKIYRKGAEEGHPVAQYNLGHRYETGVGVPKDLEKAVKETSKNSESLEIQRFPARKMLLI